MVKGMAYAMYPVKDMNRARRFYKQDLGLIPARIFEHCWVEYDLPGGCFAVTTLAEGCEPTSDSGGIALEVENVDHLTDVLRQKGIPVKLEPFSTPVCRMSVILDTEGNGIILHQATRHREIYRVRVHL